MTAAQGDAADLADLDRLYDTVRQEKAAIDVLWAGVGRGEQGGLGEITEEQFDAAFRLSLIPRAEMGHPEEIATIALFLASDDSSYVNGMELVPDGGTTAI